MSSLVVYGGKNIDSPCEWSPDDHVTVDGVTVRCAVAPSRQPTFDPTAPADANRVLVRVRAVSCNYRDRAFVRAMAHVPPNRSSPIGSEFAGEVVQVGRNVTSLRPGDRVMPQHHYTGRARSPDEPREGIPTNQASREFQVHAPAKLARVPDTMPDEEAAAFSLGAQTAYSMLRKLNLEPAARVLVLAAGSNTSLFVLQALARRGLSAYAVTTSLGGSARLSALAVRTIVGSREEGLSKNVELAGIAAELGGFDAVVDPFFDLHLGVAVGLLRPFGTYVTCGLAAQNEHAARAAGIDGPIDLTPIMMRAVIGNLTLVGNCLGLREDLAAALRDYEICNMHPVVDSVFSGLRAAPFLDRTFNARERFGKVVFRYES